MTGAPLGALGLAGDAQRGVRARSGIDAVYVPLETADADEFLAVADAFGVAGASVTAPLKRGAARARRRRSTSSSSAIGAINTLRRGARRLGRRATSTSPDSWRRSTRRARSLRGTRAVVLGAGGAARAAVLGAASARRARRGRARRAEQRGARSPRSSASDAAAWPPEPGWDLLVNTTPVGTWPHVDDVAARRATLVRGGSSTTWSTTRSRRRCCEWARAAGAETIGGLEMLVAQACRAVRMVDGRAGAASR